MVLTQVNPADGVADADGDGLTNLEEYLLGLDPFDTDTNGNGISDIADTKRKTACA